MDISKGPEVLGLDTFVKRVAFIQPWYNIITNQGDTMPIQELDEMEKLLDETTDCWIHGLVRAELQLNVGVCHLSP